jgi:hypothetical protein
MSAWLAVGILSGFAAAGGVVRVCVEIARRLRSGAGMEPDNSIPGRVMPPGVPLVHAMNESRVGISASDDPGPSMDDVPTGARETRRGTFRSWQWLRRKADGRLMLCILRSGKPGHLWVLFHDLDLDSSLALCSELEFDAAVPRKGEWWRIVKPCGRVAGQHQTQIQSDGPLCDLCVWEPVNFGRGHAAPTAAPSDPTKGHFKAAACPCCGEVLGVVPNAGRGAIFTHCGVSTYDVTITELTRPMAGEGWRLDSCVKGHRLPEDLPDLSKAGDYGYDEAGMFFSVKADWATGLGAAASLLCGCLRPVPDVTDLKMTGKHGTQDRRSA